MMSLPVMDSTPSLPAVNRMTDGCKNIILPQTSFASGKNRSAQNMNKCCVNNVPSSLFYDSVTEIIGKLKNKQVLMFF